MNHDHNGLSRRHLVLAGLGAVAAGEQTALAADAVVTATTTAVPMRLPQTEFLYEAVVEIAGVMNPGKGPWGERRIIPITGGSFEGPKLKGKVLAGGADRQVWRADGTRYLDALYEMQTDDGVIITVDNKVMIRDLGNGQRYAFSHVDITAPEGKYFWLNNAIYVGTLNGLPGRTGVTLVRVYQVT